MKGHVSSRLPRRSPIARAMISTVAAVVLGSSAWSNICAQDAASITEQVLSSDAEISQLGLKRALEDQDQTVAALISYFAKHAADPEKRVQNAACIKLLRTFRAVAAIPVLVNNIAYPKTVRNAAGKMVSVPPVLETGAFHGVYSTSQYPVAGALIEIGEPCLGAVIDRALLAESENEQIAFATVLRNLNQPAVQEALLAAELKADGARKAKIAMYRGRLAEQEPTAEEMSKRIRELAPQIKISPR